MPKKGTVSRSWCITINLNFSKKEKDQKVWDFPDELYPGMDYIIGQLEEGASGKSNYICIIFLSY